MSNPIKVLLFDIETAPNLGYIWGKWEQNVIENVSDWYILSFAYKWLGEKNVKHYSLPDFKPYSKQKENDSELCRKLHELISEADVVVAHNGDEFDLKKANARFLLHGLKPPTPYKTIDTLKVARRHFQFDSNKLDDLAKYLGLGRKLPHTGFHLWKGCMAGDLKSWRTMIKYNMNDVILLEKVYTKLLPWITFPIVRPENGKCRNCESRRLQKRGLSAIKAGWRQRYQCQDCGAWSRGEIIK
jgi:uncharacterized protein YprB with RNaseH-like and TPR domain